MRSILRFLGLILFVGAVVCAEGQGRPQFRPAVLGTSPDSLVNRIDSEALLKKGQKDGAVMFCAIVNKAGEVTAAWTYRAMPGTDALKEELEARLVGVKFTQPIYNHQPVGVFLYGTVIFTAAEKPHIRILLNQVPNEIKELSDFIAPQPVVGGDSKFDGFQAPKTGFPVPLTAVVDLGLKVDQKGKLEEIRLINEEPPLLGFADAATQDLRDAKFIPAFRNGDAIECNIVQPICYKPVEAPLEATPAPGTSLLQ